MVIELLATEREVKKESPTALRKKGRIPAIYYGRKRKASSISVPIVDFVKVWKKAGESQVVSLKVGKEILDCLIYDVDKDPVSEMPRHADFYVFEKGQKIKVKIPLEFVGVSAAVKDLGAVLVKVLREVEIEAAPKDLPHILNVDISKLANFDSQIIAKDIILPVGVALIANSDEVVASVYEPKEEVVETAPVDLSAIEVEKKGKEAKEGEVGAEGTAAPAAGAAPEKAGAKTVAKPEKK